MQRCCGITRKGEQCKRHTYSRTKSYGIEFHMCNFHATQNSILEWSRRGEVSDSTPRDVAGYLNIFWSLSKNIDFMRSIPLVMMTTHLYLQKNKEQDLSDPYTIRDMFYEHMFTADDIDEECPICFETNQEVKSPCNHRFCRACVYQWCDMRGTCPMCREQFFKIF
jgi:hypothetical protein